MIVLPSRCNLSLDPEPISLMTNAWHQVVIFLDDHVSLTPVVTDIITKCMSLDA